MEDQQLCRQAPSIAEEWLIQQVLKNRQNMATADEAPMFADVFAFMTWGWFAKTVATGILSDQAGKTWSRWIGELDIQTMLNNLGRDMSQMIKQRLIEAELSELKSSLDSVKKNMESYNVDPLGRQDMLELVEKDLSFLVSRYGSDRFDPVDSCYPHFCSSSLYLCVLNERIRLANERSNLAKKARDEEESKRQSSLSKSYAKLKGTRLKESVNLHFDYSKAVRSKIHDWYKPRYWYFHRVNDDEILYVWYCRKTDGKVRQFARRGGNDQIRERTAVPNACKEFSEKQKKLVLEEMQLDELDRSAKSWK